MDGVVSKHSEAYKCSVDRLVFTKDSVGVVFEATGDGSLGPVDVRWRGGEGVLAAH